MKLAKEILALINNLDDIYIYIYIYLVDTLRVVCFLQATALTLFTPSFRDPAQTYKIYMHKRLPDALDNSIT